jgi:hypothetical protein
VTFATKYPQIFGQPQCLIRAKDITANSHATIKENASRRKIDLAFGTVECQNFLS